MDLLPYLYETHLHTSESSRCGETSGALMARHYAALGFTGIFVTDHFVTGYSHANIKANWDKRIDILCAGYHAAKREGDSRGLDVFFAWEYPYEGGDFLTYGLDEAFLRAHPELENMERRRDIAGYARLIRQNGGFIVQAHPFREASYIRHGRAEVQIPHIDGIEVYNGSHLNEEFDRKAYRKARETGLPMAAGSDTHSVTMSGTGYMSFSHRLRDAHEFISLVKTGDCQIVRAGRRM